MSELLQGLNDKQKEAVLHFEDRCLFWREPDPGKQAY